MFEWFRSKKEDKDKYFDFAGKLASRYNEKVEDILKSDEAREAYDIMKEDGLPDFAVQKVIRFALEDFSHGRGLSPGKYMMALGQELFELTDVADQVIDDMYEKKLFEEDDYTRLKGKVAKEAMKIHKGAGKGLQKLVDKHEKKEKLKAASVLVPLAISAGFLLSSLLQPIIVSAAIGGGQIDYNVILGVLFLFFGLAMAHFTYK